MEPIALLKQTPFFASLDAYELDAIAKCLVERTFAPGQIIIREGAPGAAFYIVESGLVRVEKQAGSKHLRLADLGPGATFGEMSLIDTVPTSATVTAVEGSKLHAIDRLDLDVLLNWNPVLASKMWRAFTRMLSVRLRDMNDRMLDRFGEAALEH